MSLKHSLRSYSKPGCGEGLRTEPNQKWPFTYLGLLSLVKRDQETTDPHNPGSKRETAQNRRTRVMDGWGVRRKGTLASEVFDVRALPHERKPGW